MPDRRNRPKPKARRRPRPLSEAVTLPADEGAQAADQPRPQPAEPPTDKAEPRKSEPGLRCPNCGCRDLRDPPGQPWKTIKTMKLPGRIRRYKICRHCGHRIRTKEVIDNPKPPADR